MTVMSELLTIKEVAEFLKTSRVQVRKMIQEGNLPAVKVGQEYRIPSACLKEFIAQNFGSSSYLEELRKKHSLKNTSQMLNFLGEYSCDILLRKVRYSPRGYIL